MDDRKLRVRCAELMGWSEISVTTLHGRPPGAGPEKVHRKQLPNYPKDHNEALTLLEACSGPPLYTFQQHPDGWMVGRKLDEGEDPAPERGGDPVELLVYDEPSLARAICRAVTTVADRVPEPEPVS